MNDMLLEAYWSELPKGRENAATYERLCSMWRRDKRTVRRILHELSSFDNGDNYILIRSSHNTGFYKTDNCIFSLFRHSNIWTILLITIYTIKVTTHISYNHYFSTAVVSVNGIFHNSICVLNKQEVQCVAGHPLCLSALDAYNTLRCINLHKKDTLRISFVKPLFAFDKKQVAANCLSI